MKKYLTSLTVKKKLSFTGLKIADKEFLLANYHIILRRPKGLTKNFDSYEEMFNSCMNMPKADRQIIFNGVVLSLSQKEYFMACLLLICGEIEESEFNKFDFRPNKCIKKHEKVKRNLRKSVDDLKRAFRVKIKKKCQNGQTFNEKKFSRVFDEYFAKCDSWRNIAQNSYKRKSLLEFPTKSM